MRDFKIAFDLPESIARLAPGSTELLWATPASTKLEMEIRSIPFYVKGIALGDTVRVAVDRDRRELVFEALVKESGDSTVRLIVKTDREDVRNQIKGLLERFGCAWEVDATGILWAINIPISVEYRTLREGLLKLRNDNWIEVEEAALGQGHMKEIGMK